MKLLKKKEHVYNELLLPNVDLSKLNDDQQFAFNIVMDALHKFYNQQDVDPLRMVVSGMAGSGKSFLINCLVYAIRKLFQNNKAVQVVCPTGNSANLISGSTIHRFLKIPIGKKSLKEMTRPDGNAGEELQANLEGLTCILVDERSLVGCNLLSWMEFHCRCGMANGAQSSTEWGGLPVVVFFGDDVQLPPVCDAPLYKCNSKSANTMRGHLCWKKFNTVVHLSKIIRQNEAYTELRDVLMSMRTYYLTQQQAKWLQQFQMNNLQQKYGSNIAQVMDQDGLHVFPTHAEEATHNKANILKLNDHWPIALIK